MKVSLNQLEMSLSKVKYVLLGYGAAEKQDLEITISFAKENPGAGVMVDCLTVTATKPSREDDEGETSMSVEIYPFSEKIEPIASKTESYKIKSRF